MSIIRRPDVVLPPILAACLALCGIPSASAREVHTIPETRSPVEVDARLRDEAWSRALVLGLDVETEPAENAPAPVATEVLLTYDRNHLYVAFRAHDPDPDLIRARFADRDTIESDDFVGVVLDTFNDERRAFEFFVNPYGVQMDRTKDDVNDNEDASWDAIWKSAGRITETGYVVELAVPFSSLRFPRGAGDRTWGFDAVRNYPRGDRHRLSNNPRQRGLPCELCQLSKIVGFAGVSPGRNIEINPTITGSYLERRVDFPDGELGSGEDDSEPGLTARWGMTPNMTLSATLNPDFSQVEADSAQLDINTQFALFFPERRPFFLEGADLFSSPFQAVFTRNVADPTWGLKLTGKQGANALGVFVAEDEVTNLVFPGSQTSSAGSFDFETTDTVLRYRDVFNQSTVGALVTRRESGEGYTNQVYGIDSMFRLTDSDTLRVQALRSRTEYPVEIARRFGQPLEPFEDEALTVRYNHAERNWRAWSEYSDVGAGFRADMGFLPQVDYKLAVAGAMWTWWGEKDDWYNRIELGGDWDRKEDQSGQLLEEEAQLFFEVSGPRQSFLWLSPGTRKRHFNGVDFDQDFISMWFEIEPVGRFWFGLEADAGDAIDFAHTRPGESVSVEPHVRFDFGEHLRTRLSHQLQRLDVEGGRLFEANLTQLRLMYQINLRTFVRAIVQYTDVTRDSSLYQEEVEAKTQRLFNQLLFAYKVNPRTVLYLGYSDSYSGFEEVNLTQENRALFLKVGYAWVL